MKIILKVILFFSFFIESFHAQIFVPYRVGDKFGISDENGKIAIKPVYDDIEILDNQGFLAFTKNGDKYKKSYINRNKVILKDTDYDYFHEECGYVIAEKMKMEVYMGGNNKSTDIFTLDGKKIFDKTFSYIVLIEDNKKAALKDEILILTNDKGYYSLILLDKKTSKTLKTFFENAVLADTHYENFPFQFKVDYVLARENYKQLLTIDFKNGKISNSTNEILSDSSNNDNYRESYSSDVPVPRAPMYTESMRGETQKADKPISSNQSLIMKEGEINKKYWDPNISDRLRFSDKKLSEEYAVLKNIKNKWGYFNNRSSKWILPPEYDEIFYQDAKCVFCESFVVRKGNQYQFIEKENNKADFTTQLLDYYPLLKEKNYGKTGFYLFKLYNNDGNFVCYANGEGKKYYSEN